MSTLDSIYFVVLNAAARARLRPMLFAVMLACALAPALVTRDASACLNVTRIDLDQHVRLVHDADAVLSAGNPRRAREMIERVPHAMMLLLKQDGATWEIAGDDLRHEVALVQRMRRIYALAVVRSVPRPASGELPLELGRANAVIERAMQYAKENGKTPDPSFMADYAEVMSSLGHDDQAAPLLRWLAAFDLMGNAHAYAHLARIETAAGNTEAAEQALARCKKMAKQRSICAE